MSSTWSSIIDRLGGNAAVAAHCRVRAAAVSKWRLRGVPARFWADLAGMARQAGAPEITLETLKRPLWHRNAHADHNGDMPAGERITCR